MAFRVAGLFLKKELVAPATQQLRLLRTSNTARSQFLANSPNTALDKSILQRYRNLETPTNRVQATYLWMFSKN